jgi:hypothetical protein
LNCQYGKRYSQEEIIWFSGPFSFGIDHEKYQAGQDETDEMRKEYPVCHIKEFDHLVENNLGYAQRFEFSDKVIFVTCTIAFFIGYLSENSRYNNCDEKEDDKELKNIFHSFKHDGVHE